MNVMDIKHSLLNDKCVKLSNDLKDAEFWHDYYNKEVAEHEIKLRAMQLLIRELRKEYNGVLRELEVFNSLFGMRQ